MRANWLLWVSISTMIAASAASLSLGDSGGLSTSLAFGSLLVGATLSFGRFGLSFYKTKSFFVKLHFFEKVFFGILFFGSLLCLLNLMSWSNSIFGTASPNNLGDLPFHLHLVRFFNRGAVFPPVAPTFVGAALSYPYGVDLWISLWTSCGFMVGGVYLVTAATSLVLSMLSLWRLGGLLLVSAFFFSGGLVFSMDGGQGISPTSSLIWKNLFQTVFLTQWGFLYALPAGLWLIERWNQKKLGFSFFWIWATLPFFHLHTFAILSLWFLLSSALERKINWTFLFWSPLAAFLVFRTISASSVQGSLHWMTWWTFESWVQVIRNGGAWLLLPIWTCGYWIQRKNWKSLAVAGILTIFVFKVQLAPWSWDQIKAILWVYLLWTLWFVQQVHVSKNKAAVLAVLLFWPGLLQWSSGLPSRTHRFEIQQIPDQQMMGALLKNVSVNDVVASDVSYESPLLGSGQSLFLGYPGHAWSHGQNLESRSRQLHQILGRSPEGLQLAKEMNVKWLVTRENTEAFANPLLNQNPQLELEKRQGPWALWRIK